MLFFQVFIFHVFCFNTVVYRIHVSRLSMIYSHDVDAIEPYARGMDAILLFGNLGQLAKF
jgi:hypothetical protein